MNNKGFTLIELLVVVLIIGILAAIALPQYMKAVEKSRAAEAISSLGQLATAERVYEMGNNAFTSDLTLLDIEMPKISGGTSNNTYNPTNFKIEVSVKSVSNTPTQSGVLAVAERNKDSDKYYINMALREDGTMTRWCSTSKPTTIPAGETTSNIPNLTGTANNVALCKSIANGNAQGIIK